MPELLRTEIVAYDEATHSAHLRPLGHPEGLLQDVPALESCPGELLAPGQRALVALYEDGQAVLLGTHGQRPVYPQSARAYDSALRSFTAQSYTAYPGLSVTLNLTVTSYLWIWITLNGNAAAARSLAYAAAAYVGASQQTPLLMLGCPLAGMWLPACLAIRSSSGLAPGAVTVSVRIYVYTAGDTVSLRYSSLAVMALPA